VSLPPLRPPPLSLSRRVPRSESARIVATRWSGSEREEEERGGGGDPVDAPRSRSTRRWQRQRRQRRRRRRRRSPAIGLESAVPVYGSGVERARGFKRQASSAGGRGGGGGGPAMGEQRGQAGKEAGRQAGRFRWRAATVLDADCRCTSERRDRDKRSPPLRPLVRIPRAHSANSWPAGRPGRHSRR
jgi:hypothetical protein